MPSRGRILHVEDNADNRHLVRRVRESEGYEVIEASNGTQALEFLDAQEIDLALMDINMPDIDGYTLATRMYVPGSGMGGWLASLPRILAAADFVAVVDAMLRARSRGCAHHLGTWRARDQDGPVAGGDRPD